MTRSGAHPRHRLSDVIHAPVRLSVMAALAAGERVEFGFLRDLVEVSDSLLSKHLALLEEAGYVEALKGYVGKRPRTWLALTRFGRAAFREYVEALGDIMAGARAPDGPSEASAPPPAEGATGPD